MFGIGDDDKKPEEGAEEAAAPMGDSGDAGASDMGDSDGAGDDASADAGGDDAAPAEGGEDTPAAM